MNTILLTDDDPELVELVQLKLTDSDYRLIIARDGQEAVQTCLEQAPDLVLMDIEMPNMNGFDATKTLRSKGFTNPIIILTSSDSEEDRKTADELGCNGYILKTEELTNVKSMIDWTLLHFVNV
jgi:DNA-binding response OmpR family regulator